MKLSFGMFGHRRLTTPPAEPLPPEAVARAARAREEARIAEERTRATAEAIKQACRAQGFWWPGQPRPESRLGGRPTWRERVIETFRDVWR